MATKRHKPEEIVSKLRQVDVLVGHPTGMRRTDAAVHCGVSPGHFDKLVREGVMPSPRHLSGVDVWLRQELDDALFALAPKESAGGLLSCDDAFGL